MGTSRIRRAGSDDAAAVAGVHVASWRVAYRGIMPDDVIARMDLPTRTARWAKAIADPAWPVFLLEEGNEVVAFCHITTPVELDLDSHATAELARRRLAECTLWVLEENAPARRFYERLGMRPDGGRRTYPGTPVPEVRYRLALWG